jgi:phosphate/sulfate permease
VGSIAGNGITYVLAVLQQNEALQIIEFILSATLTVVILAYRLWHWWKEAKKDGKITEDEIDEAGKIMEEETEKYKEKNK